MKLRTIKLLVCSALTLFLSGCGEDFLNLAPIDNPNERAFFRNADDFNLAVIGVYDAVNERLLEQSGWALKEMRSDNTEQHQLALGGFAEGFNQINEFYVLPDNGLVLDHWRSSYYGISRANTVLTRIGNIDFSEQLKNQYRGEALFLRSYLYFNLVRLFGDIPMPTQEFATPSAAFGEGRVPAERVYQQLIQDLKTATGFLPLSYPTGQRGRVTQGAARALLAKVYLTVGQKAEAASELRQVISSNQYQLLPDYAKLWGRANKNSAESLFELQFKSGGVGEGSTYADAWLPARAGLDIYGSTYRGGGGQGLNSPTQDIIAAYEKGDLRKKVSVAESYTKANGQVVLEPRILKFSDAPSLPLDSDDNFPIIRYADVLLMLAEAVGPTGEGWDLLDRIRTRAGLGNADRTQNFVDVLLQERRVEFAFENHRWFDLLRFGKALDVMSAHLQQRKNSSTPYLYNKIGQVTQGKLLFPIPLRELQINKSLTQNPGY
ncbi:RagB/SusD family nutrient uptake outer membrane protein [Nibrella saemangeumensis]|uniref:RagB/SusD family nutrient uptake outer membrane protein n=1 Tax=Nibrella saemangeumensis TaxID=1084526 RepID=A0ABP8NPP4_9BACT